MLLERLSIRNYGVYGEGFEMDLVTAPKKPIVLVGGLNGAGKTTLFEAIMVALYGKAYLGARTTKKQYLEFVSGRIHRLKNGRRAEQASVDVAFRFYHGGSEESYTISRVWDVDGASVSESLAVKKNGEPMDEIDDSVWQQFIESLIPMGIARLFFFDGEKIVRVTEWQDGCNEEIKSSFDVLLGTDVIDRLIADLDLYTVRKSGGGGRVGTMRAKYDEISKKKSEVASEIDSLGKEKERKDGELEAALSLISSKESGISVIGGGYVEMREKLLKRKAVLGDRIGRRGREITEAMAGDAPIHLASGMIEKIEERLRSDIRVAGQRSSAVVIKERIDELKRDISAPGFWPGDPPTPEHIDSLHARLDEVASERPGDVFFDVSPNDAEWMQQKMATVRAGPGALLEGIDEYADAIEEVGRINADLSKIPRDDEIGPKITEINGLYEEAGMLRGEIVAMEQNISSKQAHMKMIRASLKKVIDEVHRDRESDEGVHLASKMKETLRTYHANIREKKMCELEAQILQTVSAILHKDLISRIEVDRDTLEIRVYDHSSDENPVKGGLLSMGERQMVGTALLWAIACTCGRPLPFVIDTPLGRLDGAHLDNLVDKFYPFVSHQLVLLSTNREIGAREHARLLQYIARSYRIEYDTARGESLLRDGYFFEEAAEIG